MNDLSRIKSKNCGLCGERTCKDFLERIKDNKKGLQDCPFYNNEIIEDDYIKLIASPDVDIHGNTFDFLLAPVANEKSARKIIRPYRPDLVERFSIKKGDFVMGRPMSAGCPVPHILEVYEVDMLTGVLNTWSVGPKQARDGNAVNIGAYTMEGFEGMAVNISKTPVIGKTAVFMPGFCMLQLSHYGLVNTLYNTEKGLFVRIEDIHVARMGG